MSNLSRFRPSPAMIVAVIALVAATTGGAIAGGALLTGANIKNNSVTGLDIKNNSVASADIKNNSLVGADVRNGTLQAADLSAAAVASLTTQQGDQTAGFHFDSSSNVLAWSNSPQVVAALNLPAGNYVVVGKVLGRNDGLTGAIVNVTCTMEFGGTTIDSSFDRSLDGGDRESFYLSGRGALAGPGSVTITCTSGPTGSFVDRNIEAIKVGSLP
jgi:hypothetical protein